MPSLRGNSQGAQYFRRTLVLTGSSDTRSHATANLFASTSLHGEITLSFPHCRSARKNIPKFVSLYSFLLFAGSSWIFPPKIDTPTPHINHPQPSRKFAPHNDLLRYINLCMQINQNINFEAFIWVSVPARSHVSFFSPPGCRQTMVSNSRERHVFRQRGWNFLAIQFCWNSHVHAQKDAQAVSVKARKLLHSFWSVDVINVGRLRRGRLWSWGWKRASLFWEGTNVSISLINVANDESWLGK